jgi:membrane associated rhomboid family serine protease
MATCYRHPGRETGVSCSNCGNAICTECMTTTAVGMRCPDCARQKTKVRGMGAAVTDPVVTYALIGINVLAFLGTGGGGGARFGDGALIAWFPGGGVGDGELYRVVTSAFLHGGILHILFNMYVLYWLGTMLEPSLGHVKFAAVYFASMLTGSFGALLLSPESLTVGASGAVFGLMGAAFTMHRAQGIDPMQSGIGPMILMNLGLSFVLSNISIGGHIGGLIGGALCGWLIFTFGSRSRSLIPALAICAVVGAIGVAGSIAVGKHQKEKFTGSALVRPVATRV